MYQTVKLFYLQHLQVMKFEYFSLFLSAVHLLRGRLTTNPVENLNLVNEFACC